MTGLSCVEQEDGNLCSTRGYLEFSDAQNPSNLDNREVLAEKTSPKNRKYYGPLIKKVVLTAHVRKLEFGQLVSPKQLISYFELLIC